MPNWTEADIPDQSGRTVLVTGANSGLGLRAAEVLAGKGARVLMACRSPERGETALRAVTRNGGKAELVELDLADLGLVSVAAHPGLTATNLATNMAHAHGRALGRAIDVLGRVSNVLLAQNVAMGTLPQLYAATAPDVRGGEYYGPTGLGQARGYPGRVNPPRRGVDPELGSGLWRLTAELTG